MIACMVVGVGLVGFASAAPTAPPTSLLRVAGVGVWVGAIGLLLPLVILTVTGRSRTTVSATFASLRLWRGLFAACKPWNESPLMRTQPHPPIHCAPATSPRNFCNLLLS